MIDAYLKHIHFEHRLHVQNFQENVLAETYRAVLWSVAENLKLQ